MTNDFYAAQLIARKMMEDTGMSAADVASLSLDEWARLSGRPTPAEAARAACEAQHETQAPAAPQITPQPPESAPQGLDPDSPEFFHAWRAQRTRGGEGQGIFDSVGSQSQEYRTAAARQAGRTGWANSNVVEPPRIERAFVNHDDRLDHRSAADRFTLPSNAFRI
jgi:hypothetical protein